MFQISKEQISKLSGAKTQFAMDSSFVFGRRSKTPNPPAAEAAVSTAMDVDMEVEVAAEDLPMARPSAMSRLGAIVPAEEMPLARPSAKSRLGAIVAARTLTASDAAEVEAAQLTTRPRSAPSELPAWQRLGKK